MFNINICCWDKGKGKRRGREERRRREKRTVDNINY